MDQPNVTIKQLQQQLADAQKKIIELEQPHSRDNQPFYCIQDTMLSDISSLLSLINSTEDPIWFVDCEKSILLANDATIEIFKRHRNIEIERGMYSRDYLPSGDAVYFDQIFDVALRGKTLRLNHSGPDKKEYAATIQPVKKENQIIGASVFARDITQVQILQDELRNFEQIVASTPDLIALIDRKYRYQSANDAYRDAFGLTMQSIQGKQIKAVLNKTHFEKYTKPHLRKAFSGQLVKFECWMELPTRGRRFMSITYHPLHGQDLKSKYVVVNAHDITELKQAEDERQRVFDVSLDMLAVIAFDGNFIEVNPAWEKTLGWSIDDLKNKPWLNLIVNDDQESGATVNERLLQGESVSGFESRCLCKDGSFRWLSWSSFPDMEQQLIYTAVRDITSRRRMEDELRQLATTDPLTGASNRRHFIEQASAELKRCKRYGSPMAVVMLDIDHFKRVNDNYGHSVGDEILKRLVTCCQQELRSSDFFGRLGGEEFAAVLVESNKDTAAQICQRLLQEIANFKIRAGRESVSITVSIGLTMFSATDISIDPLLKRADDALYKAKNAGRNQVVYL
jgi:diguanylate cyclase (GGDEF)-like protein/PAS domain S-box-containing protein